VRNEYIGPAKVDFEARRYAARPVQTLAEPSGQLAGAASVGAGPAIGRVKWEMRRKYLVMLMKLFTFEEFYSPISQ
jgi:hypothetical protein